MVTGSLTIPTSTVQAADTSGYCGANLRWSYSNGTLTITGSGAMSSYAGSNVPWYSYIDSITSINLPNGLTTIGNYAFNRCSKVTSINIPYGVTSIGNWAFFLCKSLICIRCQCSGL